MHVFAEALTQSAGKYWIFSIFQNLPKGLTQKVNARIGIMEPVTWRPFTLKPKILKSKHFTSLFPTKISGLAADGITTTPLCGLTIPIFFTQSGLKASPRDNGR